MKTSIINIKKKTEREPAANLLRRFTREVRNLGFVKSRKRGWYFQREESPLRKKRSALARIKTRKHYDQLYKMGKI